MMVVGLLRHGEARGGPRFRGRTDDPLTAAGWEQMHATIAADHRWNRVISSPLARCAEFAGVLARRDSLPLTFDVRLQEMHFGAWEGRTAAELMAEAPEALTQFWSDPSTYAPPGGEPLADFRQRVLDVWSDIVTAHAGQRVLVVTHAGVIRVLLCHLLQQPPAQLQVFEVSHGGLHTFLINDDGSVCSTPDSTSPFFE